MSHNPNNKDCPVSNYPEEIQKESAQSLCSCPPADQLKEEQFQQGIRDVERTFRNEKRRELE